MGYPMAVNLRTKIGPEYTVLICDVSQEALVKFQDEMKAKNTGPVQVIKTAFEAVQAAVRCQLPNTGVFGLFALPHRI
jgi:hypothetical protein